MLRRNLMHGGGNRIYGLHVIHNRLSVECGVLNSFWGLCGPRTRTWDPRTRTCKMVLEDKDFPEDKNTAIWTLSCCLLLSESTFTACCILSAVHYKTIVLYCVHLSEGMNDILQILISLFVLCDLLDCLLLHVMSSYWHTSCLQRQMQNGGQQWCHWRRKMLNQTLQVQLHLLG